MKKIIEVKNISKTFKNTKAVNNISLDIFEGDSLALLGPNGAGKTTLVEMLEGLCPADNGGSIFIDGMSWKEQEKELRKIMGLSLQETRLIDRLKVREMLQLFASFYKIDDTAWLDVMEKTGLNEKAEDYIENLSGGQKQKLALALSIMNKPRILILDEPTTGLDPNSRREIWNIVKNLKKNNTTLLLTTHYMEEAEFLCDRIIIMNAGEIIKQGSLDGLLNSSGSDKLISFSVDANDEANTAFTDKLASLKGVVSVSCKNPGIKNRMNYTVKIKDTTKTLALIFFQAELFALTLDELQCRKMNLDDLFVSLTGKKLND